MKQKWIACTVALLGLGMMLQIGASYAVLRAGATFGAEQWFHASTNVGVARSEEQLLADVDAAADAIEADPAATQSARRLETELAMRFGRHTRLTPFWAVVETGRHVTRTSESACTPTIERRIAAGAWTGGPYIGCGATAALTRYRAIHGPGIEGLVLGWVVDDEYLDAVSAVTNNELVVFSGGEQIATSMRDTSGGRPAVPMPPSSIARAPRAPEVLFETVALTPPHYWGFSPGERRDVMHVAAGDPWFAGSHHLASDEPLVMVMSVPVAWMLVGANYSTCAMIGTSIVLLLVMALLVRALITRFTRPLVALSASVEAVASGDLSKTVPELGDEDMREFCRTYNGMLASARELIALRQRRARDAGRSEIARGILHNIGNVLNSVSVSLAMAKEGMDALPLRGVASSSELLEAQRGDLSGFFANDPRGPKLVDYLRRLSPALLAERERIGQEIVRASDGLEHLARIVSANERHASSARESEACSLGSIVETALCIDASALATRGIEVVSELAPVEMVVDRHKVLQIVMNLLANARDALAEAPAPRITVRASSAGADRVVLAVEDNGTGIAAEHLSMLFKQGFTTKAHGHGIGLHESALAAQDMGGSLTCASGGVGKGAVFTLELPRVADEGTSSSASRAASHARLAVAS
jgi:signal transduction histidine kinase